MIEAKENCDSNHRAIIGLGVGLAVAIVIAIALTVLVVKSCNQSIAAYLKNKENFKHTENQNSPPVTSLASPGASVLKQPSHTGVAAAGYSVRFSENNSDAQNQHAMPEPSRQVVNQGARPKDHVPSISGSLYPSLDAVSYPTPDSSARYHDFQKQTIPERSYIAAQDLPPQIYQPHGLQYSGQPYVPQQYAVVPANAGGVMHNHGAVFIDPGSTSI